MSRTNKGFPKNVNPGYEFTDDVFTYVFIGPGEDDWQRYDHVDSDDQKELEDIRQSISASNITGKLKSSGHVDLSTAIEQVIGKSIDPSNLLDIKRFVKWLKDKKVAKITDDNYEDLIKEYGILDSAFLMEYWDVIDRELRKSNINITLSQVDATNLPKPILNKLYDYILESKVSFNLFLDNLKEDLNKYTPQGVEWVQEGKNWILKAKRINTFGNKLKKAFKDTPNIKIEGTGAKVKLIYKNLFQIHVEENAETASVWFTDESGNQQLYRNSDVDKIVNFCKNLIKGAKNGQESD